jgi:phenylalanyl-tRNA synthetase beta chain
MRVPLGWLAEWIDLPAPEALAEAFTLAGLEVEGVERTGPDLSGLRVGLVLEKKPHPNADRLSLCRVDVGEGEALEIVCGAPNVAAGQRVAVARPGTRLPDGKRLERARIRGVESHGMLCSANELGLGGEHAGILVLDPAAPVGAPLDRVVRAGDVVLEVAILPNRGDCLSLLGLAREVRTHFGGEPRLPACEPGEGRRPAAEDVRVAIDDPEGCHAYVARVVRGLRVGPSPDWLVAKLESAGLRARNVIVDVTNLVMLELGQPLHAFDLAKLRGGVVKVRRAGEGEVLTTLDGHERRLGPRDLVIADAEGAVAVAGVMGGANSEVSDTTRDVLLESAHFDPARVRHTGRRLGVFSEASLRFERGVDPEGVRRAADRAARLLAELAGGEVSAGVVEAAGRPPGRCAEVRLETARVNRLLGTALGAAEIAACLARVGVASEATAGALECRIPSWRNDLAIAEDLIEEVARVHGYARIEATLPRGALVPGRLPAGWSLAEAARDALRAEGAVELVMLPFLDARDLDALGLAADDPRRATPRVVNPFVESEAWLRSTLVPSLLRAARENLKRERDRLALFEVSRVFRATRPGELPEERFGLAALFTDGEPRSPWEAGGPPLFFRARGASERLVAALGRGALEVRPDAGEPWLHPGATAELLVGSESVGSLGGLHPEVAARFELDVPAVLLELDLDRLAALPQRPARYREVSPYPSVRRDLAVLVDARTGAGELLAALRRSGGAELASVDLFDRYGGPGVPEGKISLAFRLSYQRGDRTLTDEEVTKRVEGLVRMLRERFGATLRAQGGTT